MDNSSAPHPCMRAMQEPRGLVLSFRQEGSRSFPARNQRDDANRGFNLITVSIGLREKPTRAVNSIMTAMAV